MPRVTLSGKIFLALATMLVLLLLVFAGFSILGLQRGLGSYAAEIEIHRMDWLSQLLQKHYVANGDWSKLRNNEDAWRRLTMGDPSAVQDGAGEKDPRRLPPWYERRGPPGPDRNGGVDRAAMTALQLELLPGHFAPPPPPPWFDFDPRKAADSIYRRLGLVDTTGAQVIGASVDAETAARLPIQRGNLVIGYLVLAPVAGVDSHADRAFLARQSGVIALTGGVGLVFALVLSWLLARRWFRPIDALTQAAQDLARGRLGTRVPVQGSDELAQLGKTFNDMAEQLDSAETVRRAWLADVAHELRTPLAAMRAEIEALQDGIRSFDDRAALRLHRQVMRLGQLVDDLRSSMHDPKAEASLHAPAYPLSLLKDALAATRDRFVHCRIEVDATAVDELSVSSHPVVECDARKLHQVFMNLLDNTLAYTEAGGKLRIGADIEGSADAQTLRLHFDDSAPGVPDKEMPRLFDRLFRAESSRNRAHGGSGLGLSICRATVEAQGGSIDASDSPLGGLRITLLLPLSTSAA